MSTPILVVFVEPAYIHTQWVDELPPRKRTEYNPRQWFSHPDVAIWIIRDKGVPLSSGVYDQVSNLVMWTLQTTGYRVSSLRRIQSENPRSKQSKKTVDDDGQSQMCLWESE